MAVAALLLCWPAGAVATPVRDAPPAAFFVALRGADSRLAAIAFRLTTANVALCANQQAVTGAQFHALSQYGTAARPVVRQTFNFASRVQVENVVAASPAASAGLAPGDSVVRIGTTDMPAGMPSATQAPTSVDRDLAERAAAALPPDVASTLTVRRGDAERSITLVPRRGCRSQFEILLGTGHESSADGDIVQIAAAFFEELDDQQLAVIIAHELSHNILRHRARLEAAGASYGVFSELGKSGRLHRQAETEADLLSVYLLANAGYDPLAPGRFWRGPGRKLDPGLFRNRAYRSWQARAAMLDAEAARIVPGGSVPIIPPMLKLADQAM